MFALSACVEFNSQLLPHKFDLNIYKLDQVAAIFKFTKLNWL